MAEVDEEAPLLGLVDEDLSTQNKDRFRFKLLVPSLSDMASFKVALMLWQQKWMEMGDHLYKYRGLHTIASSIYKMVLSLVLPKSLKGKLSFDVYTILQQVMFFCADIDGGCTNKNELLWFDISNIAWTSREHIDYITSVEIMPKERLKNKHEIMARYNIDDKHVLPDEPGKFLINNRVLSNRNHSVMVNYWNCKDDEQRKGMIFFWLYPYCISGKSSFQQHVYYLLARLSEGMLKWLLSSKYNYALMFDTMFAMTNNQDYIFQQASLIRDVVPDFDFGQFGRYIRSHSSTLKDHANILAYDYFMNFSDKFAALLSENVYRSLETMEYSLVLRRRFDLEFAKSLVSGITDYEKIKLLDETSYELCQHLIEKNKFEYFKIFVELCCREQQEITKFKQNFLGKVGYMVGETYYEVRRIEGLHEFLEWLAEGDPEMIYKFRRKIVWKHFAFVISEIQSKELYQVGGEKKHTLEKAEDFLNWCLCGDVDEIRRIKEWFLSNLPHYIWSYRSKSDESERCFSKIVSWLCSRNRRKIKRFWRKFE